MKSVCLPQIRETFFVMIQAICTLCGSFTGASIRHSDWSRYAKSPKSPLIGIWIVGPLALTITGMFGVFVTSAAREMYGEVYWQPITLLLHIQQVDYSASARAGTFFAGLGWFLSQLAVSRFQPWLAPSRSIRLTIFDRSTFLSTLLRVVWILHLWLLSTSMLEGEDSCSRLSDSSSVLGTTLTLLPPLRQCSVHLGYSSPL